SINPALVYIVSAYNSRGTCLPGRRTDSSFFVFCGVIFLYGILWAYSRKNAGTALRNNWDNRTRRLPRYQRYFPPVFPAVWRRFASGGISTGTAWATR